MAVYYFSSLASSHDGISTLLLGAHKQTSQFSSSHVASANSSFPAVVLTSMVAQVAYVCKTPSVPLPTSREGSAISHGWLPESKVL